MGGLFSFAALAAVLAAGSWGNAQQLQRLHSHVRAQVSDRRAAFLSSMPGERRMNLSIVLPLRNQDALDSLLKRLYDPTSADYRKFLSVDEFTRQFGPTVEDYRAVVAFAESNGLTVTGAPANRLVVPVSGSVESINRAFNVTMSYYQHPTEGRSFFSPDREPSLNLSVPVAHIAGLDDFSIPRHLSKQAQSGASAPTALSVTGSGPGGSYLGSDMRAAYYGGTTLDGNGQAVGILEFGGYALSDVNLTFSNAGQSYSVPVNNVLLDGATGGTEGSDGEETLDIVQAIGMAPGLSQVIVYVGNGLDDANILNSMAEQNIAKQLSCSWGWRPADPITDDVFFKEFAAQGQSFFTASGDSGAFDAAVNPYFFPAEDEYVTAVGATHLNTSSAGGPWASEVAWNSEGYGSGGGISPDGISIPSWQAGLADAANGGSSTLRNVPDVAMEGDFDNYICALGSCYTNEAGTSFAAPRWAGFMALINQQAAEAGNAPNGGLGFINPALYLIAEGAKSTDLHDISSGNNDTANQPVWFNAVSGYDLVTGWGSANGQALIDDLAGPQAPGFWLSPSLRSVVLNPGGSNSTNISITDAGGFTGSVTLAVTSTLPSGVTAFFATNPTTGTSGLTLTASSSAVASTTTVTVTGTSGNLTASTNLTVAIHAPSFLLSASPSSVAFNQGSSGTATITVIPQYGFTGTASLAVSGLPSGVTASFSPVSTSGTSTLTLSSTSSAVPGTTTLTVTGTSGALKATTTISLSIDGPSFSLSAGSLSIGQGSSGTSYVDVTALYGFTGNVSLAVSGLPSGVTATIAPNPTSYSSTVTLTATSSAAVGSSTVTVTGTSGSLTASTTFTLGVFAPIFTLSSPGSLNIGQGTSASTYTYVNPLYGFTGSVNLSVSGLPSGVTASFAPNPTTSSSQVTLFANSSAAIGSSTLTITGTSGGITATSTLVLGVFAPTFSLSTSGVVSIGQGGSGAASVYVNPEYGFTGNVTLAVSGLPSGVTALWNPNPTSGTSSLSLAVSGSAKTGQYPLTITGVSGGKTETTALTLGVYAPSFSLYGGGSVTMGQGTTSTSYIYIEGQYGFAGNVSFSVSGLPSGVTASFSPNPTTSSTVLTLTASSTANLGNSTLTITGTSGGQTATLPIPLGIYAPTFSIYSYSGVNIGQGASGTAYVYVNQLYGFTGNVNFSVSGLPAGVTAAFSPNPGTGYSIMTLTAAPTTALGQYTLTITGTSGGQTATTTVPLGIYVPSFTLTGNTSIAIGQGSYGTSYITVYPQYGFTGAVNMAVSGLPSGVTGSFSQNPTTGTSILTLTVSSTASVGTSTLTITGTSGAQTATSTISLSVYAPTFTISSPGSISIGQGGSGSGYFYVDSQYGFAGNVTFAVSGLPSGVTASFSPNPTAGSTQLNVSVASSASVGTSTLTVTATSGGQSTTTTVVLQIFAPGFTLYASTSSLALNEGSSGVASVYPNYQYGFSGSVNLAASGLPSGVTASFSPNPVTGVSTLTLTVSNGAAPGVTSITITGTSGTLTASTSILLTINPPNFTLVDGPNEVTVSPGGSVKTTLTVVPQYGFSSSFNLAATGLPSGVTAAFSPNPATSSSTLTLTASSTAAPATATAVITATSGSIVASTPLTVTIGGTQAVTATTLSLTANGSPAVSVAAGTMVKASAVVSAGSTSLTTGQVNFCDAAATYCDATHLLGSAQLTSAGTAVYQFVPGAGSHGYKAVFAGTNTAGSSSSGVSNLTVTAAAATTTSFVVQSGSPGNYTLSATVTGRGPAAPSGSVSFIDTSSGNSVLGSAPLGSASSTFTAVTQSMATGSGMQVLAVGDFNGDGILDLALANSTGNTVNIYQGNGDGTFTANAATLATGSQPYFIAVGDFNKDGKADLAVANRSANSVTIFLGNGDGTFTATASTVQTGSSPTAIAVGDFNGDGLQDLAIVNNGSGTVTIQLGNGDGTFTATVLTSQAGSSPTSVALGDFNADGKLDLAVANGGSNTVTILLGNGDGSFAVLESPAAGSGPASIATGDFNGDGRTDLAVANEYNSSITILAGNGDGTFVALASPVVGSYPYSIAAGDFNADGNSDLAVANYYGNTLTILTGNGDGTFSVAATPATGSYPEYVAAGDFNGDGVPDLAVANYSGNATIVTSQLTRRSIATAANISPADHGQQAVTASYAGDSGYAPSVSATTLLTAAASTPAVSLNLSSSSISLAQALTVTVNVSGGAGNPTATGSVTLTSGSYNSPAVVLSGGTAAIAVPGGSLAVGTDALTVSYLPDSASAANYNNATGSSSVSVGKITPAVTLNLSASKTTTIQALTVTVNVNPAATGSVSLTSGGYSSAAASLSSGVAAIVIPAGSLAAGTDVLTVSYVPDTASSSIYNSAFGTGSVSVGRLAPTVTVNLSSSNISTIQALTVTVNVNPAATGSVSLMSGGYTSVAATLSGGVAAIVIPAGSLAAGTDALSVVYAPDSAGSLIYSSATGLASVSVAKTTPTVALNLSSSNITTAQALSVSVGVSGGVGSPAATGSVTLSSESYSAQQTLASGSASFSVPAGALAVGNDTLSAVYTPADSATGVYTIATQSANVAVASAIGSTASSVAVASSVGIITNLETDVITVTVSAASGKGTPTGAVTLTSGTYSAQQTLSNGIASFTVAAGMLSDGGNTLSAGYSGDTTYAAGTGATTVTVSPVVMSASTVGPISAGASANGSVTLTVGSNYSGTLNVTCTLTASPAGAQSLPSCTLNPASVTLAAGGTGTIAFTVKTTAASVASVEPQPWSNRWGIGGAGSVLAVVIMFGFPSRRLRRGWLLMLLLAAAVSGAAGCGGSSGGNQGGSPTQSSAPATTSGSYSFAVVATDANAKVTASANVNVSVQ